MPVDSETGDEVDDEDDGKIGENFSNPSPPEMTSTFDEDEEDGA